MQLKVKYQTLCFFGAITVRPRRWVQVISRHLDNITLATTVVCVIRLKKSFLGDVYWLPQCKKLERIRELSAEKSYFLHKNRWLLYEQLWWNISPSPTINKKRELISKFILANPPNSSMVLYYPYYSTISVHVSTIWPLPCKFDFILEPKECF